MGVSLQNYVLRMFSVATMERELDTGRRDMGVLVPVQRLIGFDWMISEGHPGLTSYISEAPMNCYFPDPLGGKGERSSLRTQSGGWGDGCVCVGTFNRYLISEQTLKFAQPRH